MRLYYGYFFFFLMNLYCCLYSYFNNIFLILHLFIYLLFSNLVTSKDVWFATNGNTAGDLWNYTLWQLATLSITLQKSKTFNFIHKISLIPRLFHNDSLFLHLQWLVFHLTATRGHRISSDLCPDDIYSCSRGFYLKLSFGPGLDIVRKMKQVL